VTGSRASTPACAHAHARIAGTALAGLATLAVPAAAEASPWLLQPSVSASSDHQSNATFSPERADATTQVGIGLSLPAEWQDGRYAVQIDPTVQLRRARGGSVSDTSDASLFAAASRSGERTTLAARLGYAQRDLLGVGTAPAGSPDVGLNRAGADENTWAAGASVNWRASERDSVFLEFGGQQRRYDGGEPALVGSDDLSAALSYSRALTRRLQALVAFGGREFQPANGAGRSRSASAQAGFGVQLTELWSARASYGRSRLRSRITGLTVPGAVYQVSLARRTETGALSFAADQQFQSSAFGTVVKRRDLAISYSAPITERVSASVALRRADETETFSDVRFAARRMDEVSGALSWAATEVWSVTANAGWRRSEAPDTALRAGVPGASSWIGGLSVGRRFGTIAVAR
jgi:hypothetical protein